MEYSPIEEIEAVLRGDNIGYFPTVIPLNPPFLDIMKRAGIYWPDAHRDAALMAELAGMTNDDLGFNAVNVPFDMTVEAEALGCETLWKDEPTATPQVKDKPLQDVSRLEFGDEVLTRGRFPVVLEAVRRLREERGKSVPVIPFIEGPFTIACLVSGMNEMFKSMIRAPERARWVLGRCTALSILYARALLERGAHCIIVLDPNVMGLTEKQFESLVLPCYREMADTIASFVILHICGDVGKLLDRIPESGFSAFSFDYPAVSVEQVKTSLKDRMRVIGSVPTVTHLLYGTRKDVFNISISMIEQGTDLLAPSCFIAPETPIENAKAMRDAIQHWNDQ
jgi:[methyl-Co(III) methanol-specific corrinoid protein]:coenzyme M methyltransferase